MRREPKLSPGMNLTQRTVNRLVPVLEDLLFRGAIEWAEQMHERNIARGEPYQEFNGWLNIRLLNAGIGALWAAPVDFDRDVSGQHVTITATFIHEPTPGNRMGIKVDVHGDLGDEVEQYSGDAG